VLEGHDDVAWVVHHAGYGYDTFTADASRKYTSFYGGYTYAPAMMLDRTNLAEQGATGSTSAGSVPSPTPIFQFTSEKAVENLINYAVSQPAFVTVNIERSYNEETAELQVKVYGEALVNFDEPTFMNVFLTESGMVNYQAGASNANDYVHNHVARKLISSLYEGDRVGAIKAGEKGSKSYNFTLGSDWKAENCSLYALVIDSNGNAVNTAVCKVNGSVDYDYKK
jgi:hypothetical protein